jgi:hypothetical protein
MKFENIPHYSLFDLRILYLLEHRMLSHWRHSGSFFSCLTGCLSSDSTIQKSTLTKMKTVFVL